MQQRFDGLTAWYTRGAGFFMRHGGRAIIVIVIMLAVTAGLWRSIPAALVPEEDQGYVIALPFLPPAASQQRTSKVLLEIEKALADHPARSEERRAGQEGVSTCRSRGSPYLEKNKNKKKH